MSCWCGHGPWHYYQGYPYSPQYLAPPAYHPPEEPYERPRRRQRRGRDPEELEGYLQELEDELRLVRRELAEMRGSSER